LLSNTNTKKIIIRKIKLADTPFQQGLGLMFSRKKNFNYALIFSRPNESIVGSSIHMMFVFYKIKVIFLDKDKKVVDIIKSAKPFWFYAPKKPSKYIIELPLNTYIDNIKINHKLNW